MFYPENSFRLESNRQNADVKGSQVLHVGGLDNGLTSTTCKNIIAAKTERYGSAQAVAM